MPSKSAYFAGNEGKPADEPRIAMIASVGDVEKDHADIGGILGSGGISG
jgi:hypothetical protein